MRTVQHDIDDLLGVLQNACERVSVVVAEIEIGETSTAYSVASDLENDLITAIQIARAAELDRQYHVAVELDHARDERLRCRAER